MYPSLKDAKKKFLGGKIKQQLKHELDMGKKVELEHGKEDKYTNITNNDPKETLKIATAHLTEIPDYYTRLKKMEIEGKRAKEQ